MATEVWCWRHNMYVEVIIKENGDHKYSCGCPAKPDDVKFVLEKEKSGS